MIETTDLLNSYVQGIRRLSGARSVSLYVPVSLSGLAQPLLLHSGDAPAVLEFSTIEAAEQYVNGVELAEDQGVGAAGLPGQEAHCRLLPLPSVASLWSGREWPSSPKEDSDGLRRRRSDTSAAGKEPGAWLAFRFDEDSAHLEDRFEDTVFLEAISTDKSVPWWQWLFSMGGALASHASQVALILRDPITGFPDRAGFQALLDEELERSRRDGSLTTLMLINPDEFATINERFGREAGDTIIRELSQRLRLALRSSDPIARYGGVIFAAILPDTDLETARAVSDKLLSSIGEGSFLDGAVRLGFSIGITVFDPKTDERLSSLELVRRADQALNAAKRLGGGCIVDWEERSGIEETSAFDKLSGIFTGNMSKDYRNMVLLWDTIDVIATNHDFDALSNEVVERLYAAFKPDRVGLFRVEETGDLSLVRGLTRLAQDAWSQQRVETVEPTIDEVNLLRLSIAAGTPREQTLDEEQNNDQAYAVPLRTSGSALGALLLAGNAETLALESADLIFLKALGGQLAVALDRARLAALEQERQEGERRQLKAELNELRQALQQSKLLYRSPEIEAIVATIRRVAPTDATVLITGESGTGKELLAQTVHELSNRPDRPFVIVDCGSIPPTLIESELFGHEKGAYTGAQGRRIGRLAEADTGTVFLDEIGELPLEIQSKLLRFVQEKQFSPIGGGRPRRVDVRIVAATNRNLAAEVAAGRFREDLYYRLNVVRIEVPPLRKRPDDILHLARHFVETFAVQYRKKIRRLSDTAERELTRYSWPGNVRELQNRILQAVILCDSDELDAAELNLPLEPHTPNTSEPFRRLPEAGPVQPAGPQISADNCWDLLQVALGRELDLTLSGDRDLLFPLGSWVGEDLILHANDQSQGVARRAASMVGIPETTFRRRLSKVERQQKAGLLARSGRWNDVQAILEDIVRTGSNGEDIIRRASTILLGEILERLPKDVTIGAQLLGVTPPTFRSRVRDYESKSSVQDA